MSVITLYRWLWYLLPANPLVVRIVQGGSRRSRHLWVRMGYLGALTLLVLIGLMSGQGMYGQIGLGELAKAGTKVFAIVSYGQVLLVCLLAPMFMAAAIGQEQSGETMDILLTTPLSNLQIVLGTLLGRLFFVLGLLISGLPLFAVLLIYGGVPIRSVFVAFTVAGLVAITVGSVAITLAVLRKGGRKAVYVFVISIVAYLVATYAIDRVLRYTQTYMPAAAPPAAVSPATPPATPPAGFEELSPDALDATAARGAAPTPAPAPVGAIGAGGRTTWITPLHPLLVLEVSLNSANYQPPTPEELTGRSALARFYLGNPLGTFATLSGVLSLGLVLFSAVQLRRLGQGATVIPIPMVVRRWLRLSGPGGERRRPARTVGTNPIAWREAHTRANRFAAILGRWAFAVLGAVAGIVLVWLYHTGNLPALSDPSGGALLSQARVFKMLLTALILLELAVVVLVALYMSAGCVSREREDGTLDLMLTTPITPKQYIWGKVRGLVSFLMLLLAAPILTMATVSVYTMIGLSRQWPQATMNYLFATGGGGGGGSQARYELILPEAPILMIIMLVPFVAMCVSVGMSWSIKAKGVLGAIVPSVAIIGGLTLVTGFCGYQSAENLPLIGAWINAFSPSTNVTMLLNPWEHVHSFGDEPTGGRMNLLFAALVAGTGYGAIVYVTLTGMVRGFDQTVRRLSGTG